MNSNWIVMSDWWSDPMKQQPNFRRNSGWWSHPTKKEGLSLVMSWSNEIATGLSYLIDDLIQWNRSRITTECLIDDPIQRNKWRIVSGEEPIQWIATGLCDIWMKLIQSNQWGSKWITVRKTWPPLLSVVENRAGAVIFRINNVAIFICGWCPNPIKLSDVHAKFSCVIHCEGGVFRLLIYNHEYFSNSKHKQIIIEL